MFGDDVILVVDHFRHWVNSKFLKQTLGPPQNRMNSFDSNFSVLSKSKTRHLASKVILVICNTWLFEWSFQSIASKKDTLMLILLKLVIY